MHELPLVKSIFKTVLAKAEKIEAKKVCSVHLEVGVLREFVPEFIQKYWDYITPGTPLEGSTIVVNEIPATVRCAQCDNTYVIDVYHYTEAYCSQCRCNKGTLITGRELKIKGIEIE